MPEALDAALYIPAWQFQAGARFVLCEGDDDKGLLETITKLPGMPKFQVRHAAECNEKHTGGRSGFQHAIAEFDIVSNFREIEGFVLVTDNDNAKAFRETAKTLSKNRYKAPPTLAGIGDLDGRPVKIILLPDTGHGDLEKLCLAVLISKWPKTKPCVDAFLKCTGANKWKTQASRNKALARAMIVGSYEDDPYKGLGHLFRKGVLSPAHPALRPLVRSFRDIDQLLGIARASSRD
jgi:hypothetical protein